MSASYQLDSDVIITVFRSRDKSAAAARRLQQEAATSAGEVTEAEDAAASSCAASLASRSRQPRPPIRRRPRSKLLASDQPRPKSAPPDKLDQLRREMMGQFGSPQPSSAHRDFSDEDTSETYNQSHGRGSYDGTALGSGTLDTVSAKSFGFIRPSQRLLEREQNKRLKRHKSFFNTDSLFGKKNSLIRRAESFHHGLGAGGGYSDYYPMSGKYYAKDAKERAKSVDRLLCGDEEPELDKPLVKSKSMEFLKSKILRKPSKLQKRSEKYRAGREAGLGQGLGQSMFELHSPSLPVFPAPGPAHPARYSPAPAPARPAVSGAGAGWPGAKSSGRPAPEFSKQDVRQGGGPQPWPPTSHGTRVGSQGYDWRQDTPFWNHSRHRRKENVLNWGLGVSQDPPPSWVPPPPVSRPPASTDPRLARDSLSPLVVHQAVNCMYLPGLPSNTPRWASV